MLNWEQGKQNTQKVILYFASVGASSKPGEQKISSEDQIVQTNPVLEGFGNTKQHVTIYHTDFFAVFLTNSKIYSGT